MNKTFLFSILIILFISIGSACAVSIDNENVSSNNVTLINEDNTSDSGVLLESSDNLNNISEVSNLDSSNNDSDSNLESIGSSEFNESSDINVSKYSANDSLENSNNSSLAVSLVTTNSNVVPLTTSTTVTSSFSISQITSAANTLKSYVLANKTLPTKITVGGVEVSIEQFSYLMCVAIKNINDKNTSKISLSDVTLSNPSGSTINTTLSLSSYMSVVKKVISFVSSNKRLPNYVTINNIKTEFKVYTYAFAKILAFYKSNSRLPNTCSFESGVFKTVNSTSSTSTSNSSTVTTNLGSFTITNIISAAVNVKSYVSTNKVLPSTVTVGSTKLSIVQFSYLMSAAIKNLKAGKKVSTKITAIAVTNGTASGASVSKTLSLANYISLVNSVYSNVNSKKVVPGYVTLSGSKYDFNIYTYGFAKILAFYKSNSRLPNTCIFKSSDLKSSSSSSSSSVISGITYKKGINEKETLTDLSSYLKSGGHAVITTAIKNLATSLTKNCKTTLEKANAIFKYVRDNITYSYYANSQKSASGALSTKKANCCDKSNLIVALCRAAGIAAKYTHGKSCVFSSGLTTGHVWAQIYVDGIWYAADATSSKNSLGFINNWNINSFTLSGQYINLPF